MINNENHEPLARSFQDAARKERNRYLVTREKLIAWRVYAAFLVLVVLIQALNYHLDMAALRAVTP